MTKMTDGGMVRRIQRQNGIKKKLQSQATRLAWHPMTHTTLHLGKFSL